MIINPFDNEQEFTSSDKLITHLTQLAVDKNMYFVDMVNKVNYFQTLLEKKTGESKK